MCFTKRACFGNAALIHPSWSCGCASYGKRTQTKIGRSTVLLKWRLIIGIHAVPGHSLFTAAEAQTRSKLGALGVSDLMMLGGQACGIV